MAYNKEKDLWEGFIYVITNKANGKQYVGQTRQESAEKRFYEHIRIALKKVQYRSMLHEAIRKYRKESFYVETVEVVVCQSDLELTQRLNEREIYHIGQYDSFLNGYNLNEGGDRVPSPSSMKPVCQYDLYGRFVCEYPSLAEAGRIVGISCNQISEVCRNKCKTSAGFRWCYKGSELIEFDDINRCRDAEYAVFCGEVYQFDKSGNLAGTYENAKIASEKTNIPLKRIVWAIKGSHRTKFADGFIFTTNVDSYKPQLKAIMQYNLTGEVVAKYDDISLVDSREFSRSAVKQCCLNRLLSVGGFVWRFENEPFFYQTKKKRGVNRYTLAGEYIDSFSSLQGAADELGFKYAGITANCHGRSNSSYGFLWRLDKDYPRGENLSPEDVQQKKGENKRWMKN